jgi:hypothetical protein
MTNANVRGENCIWRPHNVFSSPPTITTCFNASKISLSTSLPSLKLSLLSQNIRGGLDASGSMYIALVALKTSSLTFYNCPPLLLSLLNYASLLFVFSLNWSKALIASFWCNKEYKEIKNEIMKKHSKGHVGSLYYNCKAKSGDAWKTT